MNVMLIMYGNWNYGNGMNQLLDNSKDPLDINIHDVAKQNNTFRTVFWRGAGKYAFFTVHPNKHEKEERQERSFWDLHNSASSFFVDIIPIGV